MGQGCRDEPVTRGTNPYKWVVCIAINDNNFVISNQLLNFLLNWTLRNVVIKSTYFRKFWTVSLKIIQLCPIQSFSSIDSSSLREKKLKIIKICFNKYVLMVQRLNAVFSEECNCEIPRGNNGILWRRYGGKWDSYCD